MVLGAQSFEELLVQLRQAHQRELQEVRSAVRTQAPAATSPLGDSQLPPIAHGVGPASGKAASSPVRFAAPIEQEGEEEPDLLAARRPSPEEAGSAAVATEALDTAQATVGSRVATEEEGGLVTAQATLSSRLGRVQSGAPSLFDSYEPRFIDLRVQCMQYYPNRQWDELEVHQKVRVLRNALKPRHFMINPHCYLMRWWGAIHAFTLAFVGLATPYEIVFLDSSEWGIFLANRFVDALFLADLILQFFLQVEIQRPHRGGTFMLRDPWTCRALYLRSWFFIDLVSMFPFDIFVLTVGEGSDLLRRAKILRCLKLARLAKLAVMLRPSTAQARWKDALGLRLSTQKLIKFGIFLLMFSHWMACAWAFCGLTFGTAVCDSAGVPVGSGGAGLSAHDMTWATTLYTGGKVSPDSPCNHFAVYVAALHWAVMTLTSIGYGDIVPVRVEEYIVCIICMIAGGMLWAYVIGSICSVISNASPVERNFEMKTDLLNLAMDEANFPVEERDKYRLFLQEAKAHDRRISFGQMTESFSPMLRKQLLLHISKESMASVYYFNDPSAPRSFLLDVASCLSPQFFSQLESLDHLRHSLCMIDRGTVAHCGRILLHPSVFHEDFIVSSTKFRKVTRSVSLTYTQLLVLTRSDMEGMLAAQPTFTRKIRRCAVKVAFIEAVRLTAAAFEKWTARMPAGSRLSLRDAFDMTFGDNARTVSHIFSQGRSDQGSRPHTPHKPDVI